MKTTLLICVFLLSGCATVSIEDAESACEDRGYERGSHEHALCVERHKQS